MNEATNKQVLDKVALFHLDAHLWSGRKKLRPEDVRGEVPPKKLASLGSKRIVDPKEVSQFETMKRKAERLLFSNGVRVMGAYAVPVDRVQSVVLELKEIKEEFDAKLKVFLNNYYANVEAWILEQQEWAEIIRSSITPIQDIKAQMSFGWQVYHLRPTGDDSIDEGLSEQVGSLGSKLIKEVVTRADKIMDTQFLLKQRITVATTGSLKELHQKLSSLAFLDARANMIAERLRTVLADLPESGLLEGAELAKVFGMLVILSDEKKFLQIGQDLVNGELLDDDKLIDISGKPVLPPSPQESTPAAKPANAATTQLTVDLTDKSENEEEAPLAPAPESSSTTATRPAVWF